MIISFGTTATGGPMETQGLHIKVDFTVLDAGQKMFNDAGYHVVSVVDDAADELHEGDHIASFRKGRRADETEAYTTQSYVSEAGHSDSTGAVWNESWANGPDKEILRQEKIKEAAQRSRDATKAYDKKEKREP